MTRFLGIASGLVLPIFLAVSIALAQGQGGSSSGSRPGTSGSTTGSQPSAPRTPTRPQEQSRGPMFVGGRVVLETGRPVPEPVSVELNCGMRPLQVIHTDLGGYFTFTLGGGFQSNIDFSASNENPASFGNPSAGNPSRGFGGSLTGCELRVTVPGYHPLNYTLTQQSDMGRIEVGTLRLHRIAGVEGSAISVTSLLVPNEARKEFEKAIKDLKSNHSDSARQHLEKAIATYDKYAAAWNELGRIYQSSGDKNKAGDAFEKAIVIDSQYLQPYLNLAFLQIQDQQWKAGVETAGRALEMDPSIGFASFLQAVGNLNLNQLEAAEKSAREAEKGPHGNIPQVHALLAEIFLQKQVYAEAAKHMRTYLQEAPQGNYAEQMKKGLEQVEKMNTSDQGQLNPPVEPTP